MLNLRTSILSAFLVASAAPAMAMDLVTMQGRSAHIAERYLQIWSSGDPAAVTGVPYMYGPSVRFYGRVYDQGRLMAEKRAAVRQWPVRRYVHRAGTMKVTCNPPQAKCAVQSIIDFAVSNPARGTRKSGSARFDLGIGFDSPQPRILYEGGSLGGRRS